jgi:hypothetical protein
MLRQIYVQTLVDCARIAAQLEPESPDPRGWLERQIDQAAADIRPSVIDDPVYPFTIDEFDASVAALREFARRRPVVVVCALSTDDVESSQACTQRPDQGGVR